MEVQKNSLQNNPDWYQDRLFHFTSSELYKLLSEPREKEKKEAGELSESAKTYVYDKISEYITNGTCLEYKDFNSREVQWGKELEIPARHAYEKTKNVQVSDCGFYEYNKYFGGSPDGLVGGDGIIEIKCPFNTSIHVKHLRMKTQDDLKKEHFEYYVQIQGNFIATHRKWCDFISFDPRCQSELFALKVLRIERDEELIQKCLEKLAKANEYKEKVMDELITIQCA